MDWGYVAGYFDGEGSVWTRSKGGSKCSLTWHNTNRESLEAIQDFIGCGTLRTRKPKANYKPLHVLVVANKTALEQIVDPLIEHCIIKREALLRLKHQLVFVRATPTYGLLTKAGVNEVTRLYHDEGLNQQQIADRYGVTQSAVKMYLKRNGIPRRSRSEAQLLANRNSPAWQERNRKISEARKREWAELTPEQRREKARPMFEGRHKN